MNTGADLRRPGPRRGPPAPPIRPSSRADEVEGKRQDGNALQSPSDSTTVLTLGDDCSAVRRPFAERGVSSPLRLVEAADLDEASPSPAATRARGSARSRFRPFPNAEHVR